ncbi:DMT family transporter [Rheinheimera sp. WS51]|uniref:DMT family transporter n=1 Tax=Rheinheimera sp. WS51 TaxID=3425886 RepID=UPI003D900918
MLGILAALTTALCWAIAARLYRKLGDHFAALSLNFWKGLLSLMVLLPLSLFYTDSSASYQHILWLLLSGAIGIGIGDTCFFLALTKIGDRLSLLIAETLAPILTALFAIAWLQEWLSAQQWLAIAVILFAVDAVLRLQPGAKVLQLSGVSFAALAALCQAIGAVISRDVLINSQIDAISGSSWRLIGGMLLIITIMCTKRSRWLPIASGSIQPWLVLFVATMIGTTASLYLQMLAFSYTKAAVVQTLLATSVIISLVITKLSGELIPKGSWRWTLLALIGIGLLLV